jgi:tetratricopeptide (TPR) repeat protein
LNPRSASALRRWGNIFYGRKNYDEAIKKYNKSLQMDPNNVLTHIALGATYNFPLQQYDKALAEFNRAVQISPDYEKGYETLGLLYFNQGMYKEAIVAYTKAVALKPLLVTPRYQLALSYYRLHDRASAQREYEKLKAIDPAKASELKAQIPD